MLRPVRSTFKRQPKKRVVSRSFRIPPAIDKMLEDEAGKREWTKSFLIRDILISWCRYQQVEEKVK